MNLSSPKILIIGHARHGKDTVAELIHELTGMTFKSSSEAAAEIFLFEKLKSKYGYKTFIECFEDRMNHRAEWKDEISAFNTPDKTRLARKILERNDMYVGMRDGEEVTACLEAGLFDLVIWVDASERLPPEGSDSIQVDKSYAHIIIENNGALDQLISKVYCLFQFLIP